MSLLKEKPFLTPNDDGILGTDDAVSIQNAIDAASEAGVNKVVIPRYNKRTDSMVWTVGATIQIPENMHLVLDNCHLQLAQGFAGQMFANSLAYTEGGTLIAGEQTQIRIQGVGEAVLDGAACGKTEDPWTGALIYLHNVRMFTVEGLRIQNHSGWGICLMYCAYGKIAYIDFDSKGDDGVMLRCGCHDLTVEDITGYTGGSVVALEAEVGKDMEEAFHVMGQSIDLRDIIMKNIKATTCGGGDVVRLFNQDGAALYNILIENVSDISVPQTQSRPFCAVRIGGEKKENVRKALPGETKTITLRNVFTHAKYALAISGTVSNSLMESIHLHDDGECAVGVCAEGDAAVLTNLLIKGVYYNVDQTGSTEAKAAPAFTGEVFSFANCEGKNITVRDVLCGKTARLATVTGPVVLNITDVVIDALEDQLLKTDDKASVSYKNVKVKGQVQK